MRGKKILGAIFACAIICAFTPKNVFAAGSVSVTADKEACENGETVSVTINAVADEGSSVPPQISVEFNANRLSFDNCSTEYGGGGGGLITINDSDATIDFTTLSGGDATVNVTAVLDEDSTDVQTASVTIAVAGEDTAIGTDGGDATSTGVEASTIDTGDGRVVQTVFADEFMPALFFKSTTDYQGQQTECASFSMGDMTLLYTTDAMGNDGKFCIYNSATNELSDFRMVQGIENRFIVVLSECEGEIPAGYTKAVLDWNGQTLTAYMNPEAANGGAFGGVNPSEFFLVYALSSEGTKGWYQYDQAEGTYQRFLQYAGVNTVSADDEEDSTSEDGIGTLFDDFISRQVQTILLIVFLALVLILLIVVIVLAVKCSEYSGYDYVDPDEYYADDAYEGTGEPYKEEEPTVKRKSVTAASVVYESMKDDTDDVKEDDSEEVDETENVEDDEEQSDDEYFSPHMSRKEAKAREKELRRQEKEALKEEKWRAKEEKKARKMRDRGYEEASPMDWSNFSEEMDSDEDDRRPVGRTKLPKYMQDEEEVSEEIEEIMEEAADEEVEAEPEVEEEKLPARRINPELSERREQESLKAMKEDELRQKQKRLFEQQQRIEEQRRIDEEQKALEQKKEQEKFILKQQPEEDLDEDFQFEFLKF